MAVYPLGSAVFFEAIVDVGDDPRDQVPLAGFRRVYTSRYYAVYAELLEVPASALARRRPASAGPVPGAALEPRRRYLLLLALVLLGALGLRLWGIKQGLPYAYNADEADHFVPHAVAMFEAP